MAARARGTGGKGLTHAGRRILAGLALAICAFGLVAALMAPAASPRIAAPSGDPTGGASTPRLCSACGGSAPGWMAGGRSPIVSGRSQAPHVDPRAVGAAAAEPPPDARIGVVQAFSAPYAASYAGVGWERINFDWPSLQPAGPHSWNAFAVPDSLVAGEIAAGRQVVGIIGGRPAWAVDAQGLPRGLYLAATSPRNVWGEFVARLVKRYEGRIHDWIIWNEPDVWNPHVAGYTWPGTVADFAQLEKVAYLRIKRVDPSLVVHLAATTYWWDAAYGRPLYFARLLDMLSRDPSARAHGWYFDVASAHVYNVPDDVEKILRVDRDIMRSHGFDKPVWLVETNVAPTDDGPWAMIAPPWSASAQVQAAFVPQAVSLAIAAGAARVSFYKMTDPPWLSPRAYPSGLVRPDGTARPAIAALRAVTHALAGWTRATDLGTRDGVRAVAVDRGSRGSTLVLWNTTGAPLTATVSVAVPAGADPSSQASRVTIVGDDDTGLPIAPSLSTGAASWRVTLPATLCVGASHCRVGGAPVMVVAPTMPHLLPG